MYTGVLFIIAKTWKHPRYPWLIHQGNGILLSPKKGINYQIMKRHGRNITTYY